MPQIKLTGLKSGAPIGFMAALGAFRHVSMMGDVKLGWIPHGGQWCAVLETATAFSEDELVTFFAERVRAMGQRREFEWAPAVKGVTRSRFREVCGEAIAKPDGGDLADWIMAMGCEPASNDQTVESTAFDMTVARQLFLADALWLTHDLGTPDKKIGDAKTKASFQEALFGPWTYRDDQHSLGWDPSAVLMGAFTPKAPTAMNKAGVRAAVWLAMEALPLFPCAFSGRVRTTGIRVVGRKELFRWAIWEQPIGGAEIRALLAHMASLESEESRQRGLAAMYQSEIYKPNKYLTSFQAAELL